MFQLETTLRPLQPATGRVPPSPFNHHKNDALGSLDGHQSSPRCSYHCHRQGPRHFRIETSEQPLPFHWVAMTTTHGRRPPGDFQDLHQRRPPGSGARKKLWANLAPKGAVGTPPPHCSGSKSCKGPPGRILSHRSGQGDAGRRRWPRRGRAHSCPLRLSEYHI